MHYLLADPTLSRRTAGEEFARVVHSGRDAGDDVAVQLAVALTTTFPLAKHRPRYTVRHLLKTTTAVDEPVSYVSEAPSDTGPAKSGAAYTDTPEARFRPVLATAELTELSVEVPLPKGISDDLALFAAWVDHRVVVRLCTVENDVLLNGSADRKVPGILNLRDVRRRPARGDLDDELTAAAAEVEETGGSCDGIVAHPDVYWRLVRSGLLARLGEVGVRVSRTRMIPAGQVLLGDLRAAVTLLDTGASTVALSRGAAEDGADVVRATQRVGLAVHLPQHFVLLDVG